MRKHLLSESQTTITSTDDGGAGLALGWMQTGSNDSLSGAETSTNSIDPKKVKRRERHQVRSARVNSAYTPHNRLSRYKTALNTVIPFRSSNTGNADLPIDEAGCLSNSSFSWVKSFIVSASQQRTYQSLPTSNRHVTSPSGSDSFLLPKRPYSDSCEVNCRRLLGIYQCEQTVRGRKGVSMLKIVWRFSKTRLLIAAFFHCLSVFLMILGMLLFSNMIIESMQSVVSGACQSCPAIANCSNAPEPILGIRFAMNQQICHSSNALVREYNLEHRVLLSVGVFFCFLAAMYFESIRNWLNLRTAIRLRTAVLSSIYKRAMKSNIVNRVSSHQAMMLANEENEAIFQLVESGVQLISIVFGFLMAFTAGLVLLPASGILPLLGVLPILLILIFAANISKAYFRKFLSHGAKKLSLVEEICLSFKNIKTLQLDALYIKKFTDSLNRQYDSLFWSSVYSSKFTGGVTSAILVGGLYLIWCDTNIKTESTEVLTLLLIFAFNVQKYVLEYCECVHNLFHGKATMQKLKQVYQLSTPDNIRLKPAREQLAIQMNDVEVEWPKLNENSSDFKLHLENFEIVSGQIIGITGHSGSGKTTLLHAILRNTEVRRGKVLHRGKIAFFPSKPVLMNDTLKQNVLFGESLDTHRYYSATQVMMLNEDILKAAGTDDIPLPYLELTIQQMERIALARAVYCQRQIILLDEPLNRFPNRRQAKDLFLQMVNAFRQDRKTVIVVSQFDELLQQCDRVFRLEDGTIYREGSYSEILNIPSHVEMVRGCRQEIISRGEFELFEGCDQAALNVIKSGNPHQQKRHSRRPSNESIENSSPADTVRSKVSINIRSFTIVDYLILCILHLVNNLLYFGPFFTLIIIVEQGDIHPWLSSICLAVIAGTFFVDHLAKTYVARVIRNRNITYQTKLLKSLMNCSLSYLQTTKISDLVDLFTDTISSRLTHINACIHQSMVVAFSITLLAIANFWTSFIVPVLLVLLLALVFRLKYSVRHFSSFEHQSRRRMFSLMTNHLVGRVVVQSYDHIATFIQDFYDNVEENSTAVFLCKAIQLFGEFWFRFCAYSVGLAALLLILLLTPNSELSIHRYVLAIFGYNCLVHGLSKWLNAFFTIENCNNKLTILQNDIDDLDIIEEPTTTSQLTNSNIGVSITFRDVVYQLGHRKLLNVPKMSIQAGETVAICGKGSRVLIPLLHRIAVSNRGAIYLNQIDLSQIDSSQLKRQIQVVPGNPEAVDVSVEQFLKSDEGFRIEQINDVLKDVRLFEAVIRLPNKMDSSVEKFSTQERQLLCLARCILRKPSVILIEHPASAIMDTVNQIIRTKFAEQTVIVICSHQCQYEQTCERLIDLGERTASNTIR